MGQLVAEAIRLYGQRFWRSLALGIGPALVGIGVTVVPGLGQLLFVLTAGSLLLTASYIGAVVLTTGATLTRNSLLTAVAAGMLAFLPVPFLASVFILPAVVWLAFLGLAVPVAVIEQRGLGGSFRRGVTLARADPIHAVGGLATLAIVALLTSFVLFFVLRGQGEATLAAAAFLSILVISPVLFLGAALLYLDQEARVRSAKPTRR